MRLEDPFTIRYSRSIQSGAFLIQIFANFAVKANDLRQDLLGRKSLAAKVWWLPAKRLFGGRLFARGKHY